MESDEILDAALRHAKAVRAVKIAKRRYQELMIEATKFRNAVLETAFQELLEARGALDRASGLLPTGEVAA